MIALLAACALGSGCAAGTGAKQPSKPRSTESSDARDAREAREQDTRAVQIKPPPPPPREQTSSGAVTVRNAVPSKPVKDGPAPLVYLLPADGTVRVVDKTAGLELATTSAQARSIVRIDELTGVQLGKQTLIRGPLAAGHEYEIYLTTGSTNDVQREVISPVGK
jgi:hypothetical protein